MMEQAFIFNTNKCVACMACVAGCSIENPELSELNWRVLSTFNALRHPELPVFHFSLACNHCEEAPCKDNCPALAYTRDISGAIIHHAEACIGCKYCTWTCPYDAPKYNPIKGIVEKCTFCVDKLHKHEEPACTSACPVGALAFSKDSSSEEDTLVPGFVNKGIRPSIRLIPLREESIKPEVLNLDSEEDTKASRLILPEEPISKVLLKKEWTLVLFTLSIAILVGWFTAHLRSDTDLPLPWFLGIGIFAVILSSIHLGKKLRAWRAILNIKKSWLSREIFSLIGFLGFGTAALFLNSVTLDIITMVFGVLCLVSIDMVYHLFIRREKLSTHSAMVLLTGFMVFSVLSDAIFLIGFTLTIKIGLYLVRKITYIQLKIRAFTMISLLRLSCLLIPFLYIGTGWIPGLEAWMVFVILGLGEIIDRSEFYHEAEIPSPQLELYHYYNTLNNGK